MFEEIFGFVLILRWTLIAIWAVLFVVALVKIGKLKDRILVLETQIAHHPSDSEHSS